MPRSITLKAFAASTLIDYNIYIPPSSIPTQLLEDLIVCNSIRNLRKLEKKLDEEITFLSNKYLFVLSKSIENWLRFEHINDPDVDELLEFFSIQDHWLKTSVEIQQKIIETEIRKFETNMEEESELVKLGGEYVDICFRIERK